MGEKETVYLNNDKFIVDRCEFLIRLIHARDTHDYIPLTEYIELSGTYIPQEETK